VLYREVMHRSGSRPAKTKVGMI